MLRDRFGRKIDYLRISLTHKCKLRCRYCMPESEIKALQTNQLLTFEEIKEIIGIFKELGITKFRFTGGEPFVRKGVLEFFKNINLDGFYITTCLFVPGLNMSRVNRLKIKGINVSLDTLNAEKYRWLTRGGDIKVVLENIKKLDIPNIKINTVLMKGINEDEIDDIINFATVLNATVRFIEKMEFVKSDVQYISLLGIRDRLIRQNIIEEKCKHEKNSVAVYHRLKGKKHKIGFIYTESVPFCQTCNRIRIKANGELKLCLFGESVINIKNILRSKMKKNAIKRLIKRTVIEKPFKRSTDTSRDFMAHIGG